MRPFPRRLRHGEEATLVEHLGELRARLIVALLALAAAFIVTYTFHGRLLNWLNRPLPQHFRKPVTFSPIEPFTTSIWVSLWAALLLALPILFWQLWAFLAPAFEEHRQRSVFVLALVRLRILTATKLRQTWRMGVFVMTVIGVLLPGVDPVSTILSVIPLVGLYLLSIGLATFFEPHWRSERGPAPVPE